MSRIHYTKICILLTTVCCISCWEHQQHDILRPEIPHYTLSGYTVDIDDTTQFLSYCTLSLQAVSLLYDVDFLPVEVVSDSDGFFSIDSVFPGFYQVESTREGFSVFRERLEIKHNDTFMKIQLPKPMLNHAWYQPVGIPMTWKGGLLWGAGKKVIYVDQPPVNVFYLYNYTGDSIEKTGFFRNPVHYPDVITYANGYIYSVTGTRIYLLSMADASLAGERESELPMNGLTHSEAGFWSTLGNHLQYRGDSIETVKKTVEVNSERLSHLTSTGSTLWAYDAYRDLLLKIDATGHVLGTYRCIDSNNGNWIRVYSIAGKGDYQLWIMGGNFTYLFYIPAQNALFESGNIR